MALLAAGAVILVPALGSGNFRASGMFGHPLKLMAAASVAFALGAHLGSVLPWLSRRARQETGPSPPMVAVGTIAGGLGGFFVSAFFSILFFNRSGAAGAIAGRVVFVLAILAGSVAGAAVLGRIPARAPASKGALLTLCFLPVAFLLPSLWILLTPARFPSDAPIAVRDRWAQKHLAPHYGQAAGYVRSSPVLRELLGTDLVIAPLRDSRNQVYFGPGESTASFTLELVSPQGRGRCEVNLMVPYSPKGASPRFGPVGCDVAGTHVELDGEGSRKGP